MKGVVGESPIERREVKIIKNSLHFDCVIYIYSKIESKGVYYVNEYCRFRRRIK